jgi:formimidoylglutamate deiminase
VATAETRAADAPQQIWAEQALTAAGWQRDVRISLASDGTIANLVSDAPPAGLKVGLLLPAPTNLHSHAFQRAMAGMTERRGPDPRDTFWTWRRLMFRFLDHLGPEDIEAITAFVQMEMLEAGYAAVVEFHYVHHQPGGVPYDDPAELSHRIVAAAATSGIGLTLAPVLYRYGGCDLRPLSPGQIRFGTTHDQFQRIVEHAERALAGLPADARIAVAPHSLRAVTPDDLAFAVALRPRAPLHMHLAEQAGEVDEVLAYRGARPVEWLLDAHDIDARWCLVHCTQMLPHETEGLARSGAVTGLCPITESNLGDGIFDGVRYLDAGGRFGIGSDSNIRISLSEELRTLEYTQRLRDQGRALISTRDRSTGRVLFETSLVGGTQAADRHAGTIRTGALADLVALDATHVDLAGRVGDECLDSFLFARDDRLVQHVWSAGRHLVVDGRHLRRESIVRRYRTAISALRARL